MRIDGYVINVSGGSGILCEFTQKINQATVPVLCNHKNTDVI